MMPAAVSQRGASARAADLTLLPRGRGGDDRAFAELEARLDPAVPADPTREHLQLLTARLERQFGHALRVDDWPRQRCDRQLEADLAFADAVIMLGRERDPLEDIPSAVALNDSAHDVGEDERVARVGARRKLPLDADF